MNPPLKKKTVKALYILVAVVIGLLVSAFCAFAMAVVFFPLMHSAGIMSDSAYDRFILLLEIL